MDVLSGHRRLNNLVSEVLVSSLSLAWRRRSRARRKNNNPHTHGTFDVILLGLQSAQISYIPATVGLQTPTLTPGGEQRYFEYPMTHQAIQAAGQLHRDSLLQRSTISLWRNDSFLFSSPLFRRWKWIRLLSSRCIDCPILAVRQSITGFAHGCKSSIYLSVEKERKTFPFRFHRRHY